MNSDYEIYEAPEEEIPKEDKARLDGYLRGLAEAGAKARLKELEAMEGGAARYLDAKD